MIKKRIYLIIALAVVFVALLVSYFTVIAPMLKEVNEAEKIELLDGEVLGSASSILMFDQVERANIQSIVVHNSNGEYKFFYDENKKDFFVEGYLNSPYSKEMISSLVTGAGFPITMQRVTTNAENLAEYGLAEENDPAYYILTTRNGKTHKVYIGNMIPTGAGFYTRYDGRNAVYITEYSTAQTLLSPIESLMSTTLYLPLSQADYFTIKDFILIKGDKPFVRLTSETKISKTEKGEEYEDFVEYKMDFPAEYAVSSNYDTLLQGLMELEGVAVMAVGKDDEVISDEILEKYNLKTPAYELLFTHKGIENDLLISAKTEDNYYYVYSLLFNVICAIDSESLGFLEWDLTEYVEKPILQYNINDISSITVSSGDFEETFILYTSEGETTTNPVTGATTTKVDLKVKIKSTDTYVQNPTDFRHFYMGILTTNLVTYAEVEDETGLELLASVKVVTRDGKKIEFAFYPYTTRKVFYTLNGKGEFYVLKDAVEKIVADAKRVINGEPVNYLDRQ